MIAIVNYGVGNLFSLAQSIRSLGFESVVTGDANELASADKIILPGVGAFGDAAKKLAVTADALTALARTGKPLLGICLGMQLLFEESLEYGSHAGLGLIPGRVVPIPTKYKIPHMGWNSLSIKRPESPIMKYSGAGDDVYYVHSYMAETEPQYVVATSDYGCEITGLVQNGSVFGCQFHPEKSGAAGLNILRAFCEWEALK